MSAPSAASGKALFTAASLTATVAAGGSSPNNNFGYVPGGLSGFAYVDANKNGVKDAGEWITAAKPTYTALIDEQHLVSKLYNMVNVPTGVWINEQGRIVRPNEVAFVDDRFKTFSGLDSEPYLNALKDWVEKGDKSVYAMSEEKLRERLNQNDPNFILASAEFGLGEHLYKQGHLAEAIPH